MLYLLDTRVSSAETKRPVASQGVTRLFRVFILNLLSRQQSYQILTSSQSRIDLRRNPPHSKEDELTSHITTCQAFLSERYMLCVPVPCQQPSLCCGVDGRTR